MTKKLSPERLEEIQLNMNNNPYWPLTAWKDAVYDLLKHIDALEEEKKEEQETLKLIENYFKESHEIIDDARKQVLGLAIFKEQE